MKINIEKSIITMFVAFASCCFAGLVAISFYYTEISTSVLDEKLILVKPNYTQMILYACLFLLFCKVFSHFTCNVKWDWLSLLLILTNLIVVAVNLYMLHTHDFTPKYDQERIVNIASEFANGVYDAFDPIQGYIGWNPHQLGLVTFMRFLQVLSEDYAIQMFQYFNIIMLLLLIDSGYKLIEYIYPNRRECKGIYLILVLGCLPMYGYVPFIYGEIASTALAMFSVLMMMSSLRTNKIYHMIAMWVAMALAVQFRKNVLICVVAVAIVLLVKALSTRSKTSLVLLAGLLVTIAMVQFGIDKSYEKYTPEEPFGAPSLLYVAMGLNESELGPGWYDTFNIRTYVYDANGDVALANDLAKEHIIMRLDDLTKDPSSFLEFYRHKIVSQWCAPLYLTPTLYKMNENSCMSLYKYYFENGRNKFDMWADVYQFLIYGSVLVLLLIKAWRQRENFHKIESYTLLITIVGGILFSILWEASARYTVPYFLMMIPYAAMGMDSICSILTRFLTGNILSIR